MKKGQGQMVAFVLLVGFTVVIGIMVGGWAIQRARKTSESFVETGERDARCADVQIDPICDDGVLRIRNNGKYKVKLKSGNQYLAGGSELTLNEETGAINLKTPFTVIPFIKIEGKEYGCTNRDLTIDENTCI